MDVLPPFILDDLCQSVLLTPVARSRQTHRASCRLMPFISTLPFFPLHDLTQLLSTPSHYLLRSPGIIFLSLPQVANCEQARIFQASEPRESTCDLPSEFPYPV